MRECVICHQLKDENEFYICERKGPYEKNITSACKECIKKTINTNDRKTFDKYLKELNLYFHKDIWDNYIDIFKNHNILGRYISRMELGNLCWQRYNDIYLSAESVNEQIEKNFNVIGQ